MYSKLRYCKTVVLKYFGIAMTFWKLWYSNTVLPNKPLGCYFFACTLHLLFAIVVVMYYILY
jgi:hypothetical protein